MTNKELLEDYTLALEAKAADPRTEPPETRAQAVHSITLYENCAEAGDRVLARMASPEWQPMEIAPLDGRDVLACVWYPKRLLNPGKYEVYIGGQYEVCTARYIGGEWMDDDGVAIDGRFPVTHWMPLPEPPKDPNENTLP